MSESYNFDRTLQTPHYEVQLDTAAQYGYFEHNTLGDERGGGLWFDLDTSAPDGSQRLSLRDYDGVACLPKEVATALRGANIVVTSDFD